MDYSPVHTELLIGGHGRPATAGRSFPVANPARPSETVGTAAAATVRDVDTAVTAARRAFPDWAALHPGERADRLRAAGKEFTGGCEDLVRLLVRETGKVRGEAELEVRRWMRRLTDTAGYAGELVADTVHPAGPAQPRHTVVRRRPVGVVALITPWNWPLSILGAKLPQALLAGNTVVVKPSPLAPLSTMRALARLIEVFPPGVLNAVSVDRTEVARALVTHPAVRKIDFTGGTETGRAIMRSAAANLAQITLELGGNDPALVLEDADLSEDSLRRLARAAFVTSGQVCMAIKRVYVHRSRFGELVDGLRGVLSGTVVGDGLQPPCTMGPLISAVQQDRVAGLVAEARGRGGTVHEIGSARDAAEFRHGHFLLPALVTGLPQSARLVRQEQFGPALPVLPFGTEEEAVRLANDSRYGLCASVWSTDLERAGRLADGLAAGTVAINDHGPAAQDDRAPFGGIRDSGMGRQLGLVGVHEFTEARVVSSPAGDRG